MSASDRRGMWLVNPFDWDGGWHVLVSDGGDRPEPGDSVTVTRKDGTESAETVVEVVAVHRQLPDGPTWWLCAVEATRPRPSGSGPPEPVTVVGRIEIDPRDLKARKGCLSALLLGFGP